MNKFLFHQGFAEKREDKTNNNERACKTKEYSNQPQRGRLATLNNVQSRPAPNTQAKSGVGGAYND